MRTRFGRRSMLRGLGGTIVGLPFLEHFAPREAQAAELPKRILFLTTPNGTDPAAHWPSGGETDFTLSNILSPLEPYRDRLLVLRGVDNLGAQNTGVNGHTDTVRCMLTGRVASNSSNDSVTPSFLRIRSTSWNSSPRLVIVMIAGPAGTSSGMPANAYSVVVTSSEV